MGGLLALAFAAGMIAPVNPCGFALLPAWITHALGDAASSPAPVRLLRSLRAGLAVTIGFAGTLALAGIAVSAGARSLIQAAPALGLAVGVVLGAGVPALGLPGAVWLEMARAAVAHALAPPRAGLALELRDLAWSQPRQAPADGRYRISLFEAQGDRVRFERVRFEIHSGEQADETVHCQGTAVYAESPLRTDELAVTTTELALPAALADTAGDYGLHPALLEAALAAVSTQPPLRLEALSVLGAAASPSRSTASARPPRRPTAPSARRASPDRPNPAAAVSPDPVDVGHRQHVEPQHVDRVVEREAPRAQQHRVDRAVVDVLVVHRDPAGDPASGDGVVHAVHGPQEGRLAATRRADQGRDGLVRNIQ